MNPTVSVTLPTFNRAHLLRVAVESVLDQDYGDFELIVVDDGSTDSTQEVLRKFDDPRIRILAQENRGIGSALNTGIRAARGIYIARIDSDDRWLPELLAVEVPLLENQAEAGVAYARAQAMDETGRPLPQMLGAPPKFPDDPFKSFVYGDFGCAITALIRRECLERVGFYDESLVGNEDWDLWIRLSRMTRFVFIDRVLANFRMHPGRTTAGASEKFTDVTRGRIQVLDKVFNQPDLPASVISIRKHAYRNAHIDAALRWLSVNNRREALAHFRHAIRLGDNPLGTTARIFYRILLHRYLSKHAWGIRLAEGLARANGRLSAAQGGRGR
jgi:glycosyltransferase involved in cell wall biosynthesis